MTRQKNKYELFIIIFIIFYNILEPLSAQDIRWKRGSMVVPELALLHSTHAINLPTGETLQKGDFEFEVSHRFIPLMKEGYDAFWGMDGPANIRLGLGYALSDNMLVTLGRSNVTDNLDIQVKYKLAKLQSDILPSIVTLNVGMAWNTNVGGRQKSDARNFQYFAQVIYNTMIINKFGLGLVPSYLYNSALTTKEVKYSFTMGTYLQYYLSDVWSVLIEWNPTVTGWRDSYNSVSIGVELETGGHFFKIVVTNNDVINISQFLAGADKKFSNGDIRLGFMITRLL
jgi:hypothetical protein